MGWKSIATETFGDAVEAKKSYIWNFGGRTPRGRRECGEKTFNLRFGKNVSMKRILILYYTQSGQLLSILESLVKPLIHAGHTIHFEEIQPEEKFPFPWTSYQFFNAFPEVFSQKPQSLKNVSPKATNGYDVIILGYQPWFLTPSRPVS